MSQYLKPKQHYIDRYDKMTVEDCRRIEKANTTEIVKRNHKKHKKEELLRVSRIFNELHLYFLQGEYYAKKEEKISEWMREDEERDRFFEITKAPENIRCLTCDKEMFVSSKHLDTYLDKPDKIMFIYDCPTGHLPRRVFYNNGEEWKREKPKCSKCQTEVKEKDEDTKKMFRTTLTCPSCGYVEVSEIERTINKTSKEDPDFEKDRERFCDPKKGLEYVDQKRNMEEFSRLIEKENEKEKNKELYDKVAELKKLSIPQVKELLTEALAKTQYKNIVFEKPKMERIVSMDFNVEDTTNTGEYDSRTKLARLLKKTLGETTWRLMSDGVSYRLGILTGRIRVFENEEELVKLVNKNKK